MTPRFLGVPNAKHEERRRIAYLTRAFSGAQKRAQLPHSAYISGYPQRKLQGKTQNRLPNPCFLGGQKRAQVLCNLYIREGSRSISQNLRQKERKSELATTPVPSRSPKMGWTCYITNAFSGVHNAMSGEKIRSGYLTPAFSRAQNRAEMLLSLGILGGSQSKSPNPKQKKRK